VPVSEEESFVVLQPTLQRKGKAKCQRCIFQKGKHVGVTTNIYLRKMLEKMKKKRSADFENKGSGVIYAWGRY